MGGLFSKPKSVKAPAPPAPEPPPSIEDTGVEEATRKKIARRSSRRDTFLTGDLIPETDKKRSLP